ncbi:MAG TPA: asparagine synthase (glutamine-hydrolyzing) [Thermoanaerobaculia bacterium]
MCGIFGFTGPPAPESLAALRLALRHRGPDGEGEVALPAASLGCDRLAIVSLASGAQPLANEDGSLHLVCNGEIYNHRDLRRRLEARGHRFATGSDSEVVLHAFEEGGAAALAALHGMFALALWDEARRQLVLARDASGMKPLHYAWHEGRWWFASEAKALLLAAGLPRRLDLEALDGLLRRGFVPGPRTLFAGIARLPAGHCLAIAGDGQPRLASFVAPAATGLGTAAAGMGGAAGTASAGVATRGAGGASLAAELRRRLTAAVESHLEADVPVGASLSGGLDSSLLVALMAERAGPGVKTFAIGCPGDQDERPFAHRVADRCRTEHTEIAVRPEDLWARLPRVLWNAEEPRTGPLVPNDMLFERAARDVRVLLVGEGADELFGGYLRFKTALPPLGWLPRSAAAALYGTRQPGAAADLYGPALAAARGRREPRAADLGAPFDLRGAARLAGLLDYERRVQLPNAHLARVDLLSMAHAVEARLPYLDAGVVAFAERVPLALKVGYRNEKMVLREAARGLLPPAIAARRKLGQANPFRLWDAAGMLDLAATLLGPATHARGLFQPRAVGRLLSRLRRGAGRPFDRNRLHLLVLVEVWHRVYLDPPRLAPPDVLAGLEGLQGLLAPATDPGSSGSSGSSGGGPR